MKKLFFITLLFLVFSCNPVVTDEENIPLAETDVRIVFFTTETNYDEIEFS